MVRSMITTVINPFDGLISRYFVTLDPVLNSYYEVAQPITFAGDFEIEVEFSSTSTTNFDMILSNSLPQPYLSLKSGKFAYNLGTPAPVVGTTLINDGKLNKAKLTRVGSVVSLYINGVFEISSTNSESLSFIYVGRYYNNALFFDGIIANAKFTDKSGASDVVTTFKLNNSPAAENYTYSTELLDNNTFPDNANARQYLVATKGWIITDGGAA